MLKVQYQSERQTRSWDDTIRRERRNANKFLAESPSLKFSLNELFAAAYEDAVIKRNRKPFWHRALSLNPAGGPLKKFYPRPRT
jgi:uncharacterized protein DUF29